MNFYEAWEKALKNTEIIRSRIKGLNTFRSTSLPYVFLSPSDVDRSDTVVRKGQIVVKRPSLILPPHVPIFEGFDFDFESGQQQDSIVNFLLVRGIQMPSMRYNNKTYSLDIFEGDLDKAIGHFHNRLQQEENVQTGLLTGPQDYWQFSILIYICSQIARNAEADIRNLLDEYKKKYKDPSS